MLLYRLFLTAAAIVAAIALYFFAIGIADGSVSSFNIVLWLGLLAAIAVSLGGGIALNRHSRRAAATALLSLVALPGIGFGLFMLVLLLTAPHWQ